MKKTLNNKKASDRVIFVIMSLFAVVQIFPLVWLVDFSLNTNNDFYGSDLLKWPNPPNLRIMPSPGCRGTWPDF